MTEKQELRAAMRAMRKRLAETSPRAAEQAADYAGEMLDALFATTADFATEARRRTFIAALYKPQGSELDTAPLARALAALGVDLALPVVLERDAPLIFRRWVPGDPLELDLAGCPAPLGLAEALTPDLILVPLLAFDAAGGRLGQGGGYYDRTLALLRDAPGRPAFVGLAYAGQQVEHIPMEKHDQPLHGVLTEAGYIPAQRTV